MLDYACPTKIQTCSLCTQKIDSPDRVLAMDEETVLCTACYCKALLPGYVTSSTELLDE